MSSSGRHRRADDTTDDEVPSGSEELGRLADAQSALQRAREQPAGRSRRQRRRAEVELEAAAFAVQTAAEAAHAAGLSWTQIGDALGMNRATPVEITRRAGLAVLHGDAGAPPIEARHA